MSYSSTVFQSLRFDTVKRVPLPFFVVPAGSGNLSAQGKDKKRQIAEIGVVVIFV